MFIVQRLISSDSLSIYTESLFLVYKISIQKWKIPSLLFFKDRQFSLFFLPVGTTCRSIQSRKDRKFLRQSCQRRYYTCLFIIENNIPVAFGSCGYYRDDNYYCQNKTRQLWIEGIVSTVEGYGTVILSNLEKCLISLAHSNVSHRLINVISVEDSVGFYENDGYVECNTSSRFRGTGNIRMVKAIDNFDLESAKIRTNWDADPGWIFWFVMTGRRKVLEKYMHIPTEIKIRDFRDYIINTEGIFRDNMSEKTIQTLIKYLKDGGIS